MGISVKKPSRSNTPRSQDFINNFLKDVLKTILRIEMEPSQAESFTSHFDERSPIKLVFNYSEPHNQVNIELSPLVLTKGYGKPAMRIWRKLFMQVHIGGHNVITREKSPTRWAPHDEAIRELEHQAMARIGKDGEVRASDYLHILADFPEIVPAIIEYETQTDPLGFERLTQKAGTRKKLVPRPVRARLLAEQKPLRAELAVHNSERFRAMKDQQTFDPDTKLVR